MSTNNIPGLAERTQRLGLYAWADGPDLYNHVQLDYNWNIIDRDLIKKSWAGTADNVISIRFETSTNLGGTAIAIRAAGDVDQRVTLSAGGTVSWGNGTTVQDTNLYRDGTAILATDSIFKVKSGNVQFLDNTVSLSAVNTDTNRINTNGLFNISRAAGGTAFTVTSSAGPDPTFIIKADGYLGWGTGTSGDDVSLFRSAPNTLTVDGDLVVTGSLSISTPSSTGWSVTSKTPGIKTYDANNTTLHELADVLGNLIDDLKDYGILGA